MSLSLLLEKYDVSTEEGLQKALKEIEKEESEVDNALASALSRSCTLEGKLRTTSQAYTKLGEVKRDAEEAANMVEKTALLAQDVSAKVRQLDLARSRVAECQRRVHDLIDLQLCSAGVEAAIKAHDYETGARHVARFLSMEPGSVAAARARGAADPRDHMARAARTLSDHLVRKFEEAARKEDDVAVERLFKLFPQIGRAEEGVDLLAQYLTTQMESKIRKASGVEEAAGAGAGAGAPLADALTRVLEAGAAAVQRARALLAQAQPHAHAQPQSCAQPAAHAHNLLPRALRHLQPAVCDGARRVWTRLERSRRPLPPAAAAGAPPPAGASPLAVEPPLADLALAHSRLHLYFTFLRRNIESDTATLPEAERTACIAEVEKIIAESDLMRTAQDILSHYLELERYFLEESVNKALRLSNAQTDGPSSFVDDVFFLARKVIRRSISAGSVDGACAVLNEAAAVLERAAAGWLRRRLASPPPEPLPLPPPAPAPAHAAAAAAPAAPDLDAQRALYLEHLNTAESGAEWSERLAAEAVALCEPLCSAGAELAKLRSCAAGLGGAAAAFRHARHLALAALGAALQPRLDAWAARLAEPLPPDDEAEEDASALPAALDALSEAARARIPNAADELLAKVVAEITARAERAVLRHHYDRVRFGANGRLRPGKYPEVLPKYYTSPGKYFAEGRRAFRLLSAVAGARSIESWCSFCYRVIVLRTQAQEGALGVERRARRLAAWAGGGAAGARDKCARLTQLAALLALERPHHAPDALRPQARLAPALLRDVLARRTDFKMEEIKRLKL
ncbi:unnamed protein product, partial [Iphiclides podalirius]